MENKLNRRWAQITQITKDLIKNALGRASSPGKPGAENRRRRLDYGSLGVLSLPATSLHLRPSVPICGYKFLLLSLILIALTSAPALAKDIEIEASVSSSTVFIGETVLLTIKVHGYKAGWDPEVSLIQNCDINYLGHEDHSSRRLVIINGRRQVSFRGRIFQYNVTPTEKGTLDLGPIHVKHEKFTGRCAGPRISVREVLPQDWVFLEVNASQQKVIVNEPFTVELKLRIQSLPPPNHNASQLPAGNPPHLHIPYLKDDAFEGLEGPKISKLLQKMLVQNSKLPGFSLNEFTLEANPFDNFFGMNPRRQRNRAACFEFKSKQINLNGRSYIEYSFPLTYMPTAEGEHTFGPISFKGEIFVGVKQSGDGILEKFFTTADALTVRVTPPPEKGRPASYIGAIGTYVTAASTLDTQTCKVGDPLTFEITIGGDSRLDNIVAPNLSLQEGVTDDFRVYEDSVHGETRDDKRIYQYTIRPSHAGTLEFPAIAVSFYNTLTKSYDTVKTDPIPLRANPATEVENSIVIDTAENSITIGTESSDPNSLVPAPIDISANLTARQTIFVPALHVPLLLCGPLLFLIGVSLRFSRTLLPAAAKRQRQTTAPTQAIAQLRQAAALADTSTTEARQALTAGLRTFVDMRFDISSAAFTPPEYMELFTRHTISEETTAQFTELLEISINAGFQTIKEHPSTILKDVNKGQQLIEDLERELQDSQNKHRSFLRFKLPSITIALGLLTTTGAIAINQTLQFESQLATTELLSASTPEQFDRAAIALERMLDSGACNPALLYNYGTTLLMAGHHEAALRALLRSERYSGTSWELVRNMRLALRGLEEGLSEPRLPWYRTLLFWHYKLPGRTRTTITAAAFLLIWIALLLRLAGYKESYRGTMGIAIALLILFGSSAITTLYKELHPEAGMRQPNLAEAARDSGELP